MVGIVNGVLANVPFYRDRDAAKALEMPLYEAADEPCSHHGPYPARYTQTGECRDCWLNTKENP